MREMTTEEALEFLSAGTRTAKVAWVASDGRPHVAPIWFVVEDGDILFATSAEAGKSRAMRRDARVSLVVDVEGFNGESWLDRAGNFASNTLRVTERYTPISRNALMYEATMEDPNVFTRPWTIRMPVYRRLEENARVLEFKCVEFAEDLVYGHLRREPTR